MMSDTPLVDACIAKADEHLGPLARKLERDRSALLEALIFLHANQAEYQRINNIGGYDNHDMRMARAAIAKAEKP